MTVFTYLVFGIYLLSLTYVTIYDVLQLYLLVQYLRKARLRQQQQVEVRLLSAETTDKYPFVTVQLPVFNEKYVIDRLIDRVAAFDYPIDRYEIHILDDSTDETVALVAEKVAAYQAKGHLIRQIRREKRQGFKAGALRDALPLAQGEFIAIFDADFLPEPDFLHRTIPFFQDERVGVVQTRWAHINEHYSLLTRLQAVQINVHFSVEQVGRMVGNHFLQFNGTAGVWRKATIDAAGGWEADTLTEDLDLSIRAQLQGWHIEYLEAVGSPAELPAEMNGLKTQQFRWMKGGAETAKKMLPLIWRAPIAWTQKLHATYHLLASTIFLFVFVMGVSSVPVLFFLAEASWLHLDARVFAYFLSGLLSITAVYFVGNVLAPFNEGPLYRRVIYFVVMFPLFLSLSMGLSLHNTRAIIQGYRGKRSPFVRTPKFNIQSAGDSFVQKQYKEYRISSTTLVEGLLAVYFGAALVWAIYSGTYTFIAYHLMLFAGFGFISIYSIRHALLR